MPESRSRGRYGRYLREVLMVGDLLLVNLLFGILCWRHPDVLEHMGRLKWVIVSLSYLPVALLLERARLQRALHIDRLLIESLRAVILHALIFITLLVFLNADDIQAGYILEYYAMMIIGLPIEWVISRLIIKALRHRGINYSRVVIVGTGDIAQHLTNAMLNDDGYGYRILGCFDDTEPQNALNIPYCGKLNQLEQFIIDNNVDEVFFAPDGSAEEDLLKCIRIADDTMVQFHYMPHISPYAGRQFELSNIGGLPVLTPLLNPLNRPLNRLSKRIFDFLFSSVALICSPILFIPIAIAVKASSPGPVFFKQKRTGYRGREFYCLKFRTMRVNADADKLQATSNDPRKTKVGDFLRRTSLDELPQFINVWRGEMSIVGPRPHMLAHTEQYKALIDRYMIRHMVKPGITGWAQVCGFRGNTDELIKMEKRVRADMWYIEHWSAALDFKIIIKTIVNAFSGEENAY